MSKYKKPLTANQVTISEQTVAPTLEASELETETATESEAVEA